MLVFFRKKTSLICVCHFWLQKGGCNFLAAGKPRHWCPVHIRSSSRHYFSAPCGNWDLTTSMTPLVEREKNHHLMSAWGIQDASTKNMWLKHLIEKHESKMFNFKFSGWKQQIFPTTRYHDIILPTRMETQTTQQQPWSWHLSLSLPLSSAMMLASNQCICLENIA